MAHPKMPAQLQRGTNRAIQPEIHRVGANAMLFHCIRKAGSCLGCQILGGSLLPVLLTNEKIKLCGFQLDPPVAALCFCIPLQPLQPKEGLLRRNGVTDAELFFLTASCCLAPLPLATGLSSTFQAQPSLALPLFLLC